MEATFLTLFNSFDLIDINGGVKHVDSSPWYHDLDYIDKKWKKKFEDAKKERGNCSNAAYRIKKMIDHLEQLIEEEEDADEIANYLDELDDKYHKWRARQEKIIRRLQDEQDKY